MIVTDTPEKGIAVITLNRPEKRNALSIALLQQLASTIQKYSDDIDTRCIIISGNGPVFCAGLDLHEASDPAKIEQSAEALAHAFSILQHSPKITIAAVHGAAIAGGAGLLCACDYAVATKETQFAFPETYRGLIAIQILPLLYRQMAPRAIRELLLIGKTIDANDALRLGVINQISNSLHLDAIDVARHAMKGAPKAIEETKQMIEKFFPTDFDHDLQMALKFHELMRSSPEAAEGIQAFQQKRKPSWQQ
ncbi:MAG: enoyl-CoA hydratase/isomerase family protein [Chlamydiales bacterium]|nr:enoyl-CoA hydratase/isomerase family protein [Chlamydiia bacterium]MCP5508679.1 enoyl-CoA hydratase/isomerase family protein [Chlamydiales bacterium]